MSEGTSGGESAAPREVIQEELGEHRELLERLVELDTELSDDAARALQVLDEDREGQS